MAVVGRTSSPERFEDFARNVLERSSMRQIDQKSINILYDPIGQLTNRKNRKRFYAVLLATCSFAICPHKEKQTQLEFYRSMPLTAHGKKEQHICKFLQWHEVMTNLVTNDSCSCFPKVLIILIGGFLYCKYNIMVSALRKSFQPEHK